MHKGRAGCNEAKQSRKGRDPLQPRNYFVKREEWLRAKSSAGERLWDPCCCREVEWPLMPTRLPGPNGMCPVLLVSPATRHSFDECHGPQNNLLWFRIAWNQRFLILTWFYRKDVKTVRQTIWLNKIRTKFAWLRALGKHFNTQEPNKQTEFQI